MTDEDPLRINTDIGSLEWSMDWDLIEQMIEAAGVRLEDMETTKKYARYLFVLNVQHAVGQTFFELRALTETARTGDRSKRWRIATKAAENAKRAALARLRSVRFFSTPTKARGRRAGQKQAPPLFESRCGSILAQKFRLRGRSPRPIMRKAGGSGPLD
jgi:hypothetical protein